MSRAAGQTGVASLHSTNLSPYDTLSSMPPRIIPVGSFAESQARSPPDASSIKTILLQLLNYGEEREWEVDGITPALFVELRDYLYEHGWENMR
jgi:hypothetical protein